MIHVRKCALTGALASAVLLTGCVSTVSGKAERAQNAAPIDAPPLRESDLDRVLLSVGELNGIMGSTTMTITSELEDMTDHSGDVSDPDCLGAIYGAEEPVYAGTGWTAMRDQVAREPDENNEHWVEQTAVLYPTAQDAQDFFAMSQSMWQNCGGDTISVNDGDSTYLWRLENVTTEDTLITQTSTQEDADGWACQHALSVVSNLTVEAWACSYAIGDEAAAIAADIVANAEK
ncbi:sensor domain-containing protein [Mycobacterium deserti]|uniref:Sensor domain-containing protein n=1 Tax=Mycobacterium deserti TaxID=2978347 RepID=A0ABT2MDQ2_9MYCO|nr:sensor domain-containing protein [Mycobacterium deserti]MCT7660395.1 sensor domain-containing protein [Mycobacterium deserti]